MPRRAPSGGIDRDFPWLLSFLSTSWSCKLGNWPSGAIFKFDSAASAVTNRATLRACGGGEVGSAADAGSRPPIAGRFVPPGQWSDRRKIGPRRHGAEAGGWRHGGRGLSPGHLCESQCSCPKGSPNR